MAPLPPNGTPRFKFTYETCGEQHDMQLRHHGSPAGAGAVINDLLLALSGALYAMTLLTVEFAADGSNIFLPVTSGFEGNTYGGIAGGVTEVPNFYGFVGRTTGGKRWHLDVFGALGHGVDYRYAPGENGDIDSAVAALVAFYPEIVGIDDLPVSIYPYVNAGVNSYWQRAVRP